MIDWAPLHPQVVHFVVALGLVGIVLRLISLTGRATWTRPAGAVLLILAAISSVVAVKSGTAAHGPVERIPGAREAVEHHEEAGETTRNLFLVVGVIEVAGLALASREKVRRWLLLASAIAGVVACVELYEAADEGGELVYVYGGGPGLRSGDPADVQRLLVAGLYAQAAAARDSGRAEEAARLTDELVRLTRMNVDQRFPAGGVGHSDREVHRFGYAAEGHPAGHRHEPGSIAISGPPVVGAGALSQVV